MEAMGGGNISMTLGHLITICNVVHQLVDYKYISYYYKCLPNSFSFCMNRGKLILSTFSRLTCDILVLGWIRGNKYIYLCIFGGNRIHRL